nr:immunoglobulin light chain junction region [Macaca mulatta]MOV64437.1 immunoglobulin light chain junction region [Macaca mulatta]
CQQHQNYPRTF